MFARPPAGVEGRLRRAMKIKKRQQPVDLQSLDGEGAPTPEPVDTVEAAAAGGLDLRSAIVERHALPATGSSRPRTLPRPTIEIRPGLWRLGGAAWAGAGLEITGMGTAALAAHLGPAPR